MAKKPETKTEKVRKPRGIKAVLKNGVKLVADSSLPEMAFISIFILGRWYQNSDFSYPSELIIPLLLFSLLASAIYYSYRFILGRGLGAHLSAISLSFCLYSFSFIKGSKVGESLEDVVSGGLSEFGQSLVFFLALAIIFGFIGWLADRAIEKYALVKQLQPYKILLFALAFVFVFQVIKTGNRLLNIQDNLSYQYQAKAVDMKTQGNNQKPDIYYLVFDRYGNNETLKNIYNFDNSELLNDLSSQGFTNRDEAYANYPFTMSSVSSTLAMNYLPELGAQFNNDDKWQPAFAYRSILNNPPVAQLLRQNGYSYNQLSSWWDFTRVGIQADSNPTQSFRLRVFNKNFYLSDLQRDIVNKSILSPWLKKGISFGDYSLIKYDLTHNPQENFENQVQSLKNISSRPDKSTPQFSFAHVLVPHDPYIFDSEGNTPSYDPNRTDSGADETVKYTNQLTYLNNRIKELIGYIRQHSPDAAIVIQADEGPYPKQFRGKLSPDNYYDPVQLEQPQMRQKFGILASYYLPGANNNTTEQVNSSVNAFRYILSTYMGYDLPLLPDCHFSSGNKYTIYKYTLVSQELTGREARECDQYN